MGEVKMMRPRVFISQKIFNEAVAMLKEDFEQFLLFLKRRNTDQQKQCPLKVRGRLLNKQFYL